MSSTCLGHVEIDVTESPVERSKTTGRWESEGRLEYRVTCRWSDRVPLEVEDPSSLRGTESEGPSTPISVFGGTDRLSVNKNLLRL